MDPTMRKKLERNLQYHAAMAEYHQEQLDARKKESPPPPAPTVPRSTAKPTASASPPKVDADELLAKTHSEVVKQLQDLLDKEPIVPAILTAEQTLPVQRNLSGDLKPTAGKFH